jgi:hypothetical protein
MPVCGGREEAGMPVCGGREEAGMPACGACGAPGFAIK